MTQAAHASTPYRPDVDGLRAVSILGVLLFHAGFGWLPGGFVGVDVFFVISGFLITGIIAREIDRGDFTYANFYERRIRLIYPALIVVLLATLFVAWIVMIPLEFRRFGRTLVWAPLFASNFAFMGQTGYFDPDGSMKPLLHTWSLGVEEQFYIVFPLILGAVRRWGGDRRRILAAIVALSFAGSVVTGAIGWGDAYFLLPVRFWELGCGAMLAIAPLERLGTGSRAVLSVGGAVAIVGSMFLIDSGFAFPGWVAAVPVLGATAVLAGVGGPANRLLATAPMVFVGRISYPMYLWHWPVIVFAQLYLFHPLTPIEGLGVVAVTVILSWLTLVVVETPIRSRRVLASRRALFVAATIGSLVVIAGGLVVFNFKTLNRWTSPLQEAIVAVKAEGVEIDGLCPQGNLRFEGPGQRCAIGARGAAAKAPSFAVLGDSHARAIAGQISTEAAALGLTGHYYGRIACPPLPGIDRPGDPRLRCADHMRAVIDDILAADIGTVILVSRWAVTVTGHDYGRSPAEVHPILLDGRRVPEAERAETVRRTLEALVDRLPGRRVIVVDSIPEVRFDVPSVLANAERLGRPRPPGPTRAEFEARQATVRPLLRAFAEARPGVRIVEPSMVLCDAAGCPIIDGEKPRYIDEDHLSLHGAALLGPLLREALAGAVR